MTIVLSDFGDPLLSPHENQSDEWRRLMQLGCRVIPPYPGVMMFKPVQVPDPPKLRRELGVADGMKILRETYQAVRVYRFPKLRPSKAQASDVALIHAFEILRDLELPPFAWALSSFDAFAEISGAESQPGAPWVWSGKRLEQHAMRTREAYEMERQYRGGRIVQIEEQLSLGRRWLVMQRHLLSENPKTLPSLQAVVDHHFEPGEFEQAVERISNRVSAAQAQLDRQMWDGVCLWG